MRPLAYSVLLLLACARMPLTSVGALVQKNRPVRPNFIFIYADDLGYGDLGCYGHPIVKTPNLDQLAQQGTLFTQYYDSHSVCSPTRASFITGHYPSRHRIFRHLADIDSNARDGMPNWLDVRAPSLPRALQKAGYRTAMFGKWHLGGGSGSPFSAVVELNSMEEGPKKLANTYHPDAPPVTAYGFDVARTVHGNSPTWYNAQPHPEPHQVHYYNDKGWRTWSSKAIADAAIEFLEDNSKSLKHQPFLMNAWLTDPHTPMEPTAEMRQPYQAAPEPAQTHYAMITFMDQQMGRLLKRLKELGLEKNTLVIFSSDNGAPEGRGGSNGSLRGWKWSLYEGGIRVPFIVRWPGRVPAGKTNTEAVLNIVDLASTFCRLAGASMPKGYEADGVDFSAALLGRRFKRNKPMMWHHPLAGPYSQELAVRDGQWKLLMNPDGRNLEVYNLAEDLSESNNVAAKHPEVTARLRNALINWYRTIPHPHPKEEVKPKKTGFGPSGFAQTVRSNLRFARSPIRLPKKPSADERGNRPHELTSSEPRVAFGRLPSMNDLSK